MTLSLELPPDLQDALAQTAHRQGQTLAEAAADDLRLLYPTDEADRQRLAVALYHARLVSQGRAAGLAGLSRAAFLDALARHGVSAIQYDADEAVADAARITAWRGKPEDAPDSQSKRPPVNPLATPGGRARTADMLAQLGNDRDEEEQRDASEKLRTALEEHPVRFRRWNVETWERVDDDG